MNTTNKLPLSQKLFYAFGQANDAIPMNLFYLFFLYYLTDMIGINPATGGTIILIVVLWDAITDPLVGYLSDNLNSKYGKRKPFMLLGSLPLYVCGILIFTSFNLSGSAAVAYYLITGILFWSFFTVYAVPYYALGAEMTQDFNERNNLRGFASFSIYISVWIVSAGPMTIVDAVTSRGGEEIKAWQYSAIIFGFIAMVCAIICILFVKTPQVGKTEVVKKDTGNKTIITSYLELLKLKSVRKLIGFIFATCIGLGVATGSIIFLMTYNMNLPAATQAKFWSVYVLLTFIIIPICNILANKMGKKQAMLFLYIIAILTSVIFYFTGFKSFMHLVVYTFLFQMGNIGFWTIGYSLTYDCTELDEYVYGARREGAVIGVAAFMQKFGTAVGAQLTGIILAAFGYIASLDTQSASALRGILMNNTLIPALFFVIASFFLLAYPIKRDNYNALLEALHARKEKLPYSEDGFKELL